MSLGALGGARGTWDYLSQVLVSGCSFFLKVTAALRSVPSVRLGVNSEPGPQAVGNYAGVSSRPISVQFIFFTSSYSHDHFSIN